MDCDDLNGFNSKAFTTQHLGFYFSDFKYKFNPKYMNLSLNMAVYNGNTKKHPVYQVPEARIEIFEDIPRLHVGLTIIGSSFNY